MRSMLDSVLFGSLISSFKVSTLLFLFYPILFLFHSILFQSSLFYFIYSIVL